MRSICVQIKILRFLGLTHIYARRALFVYTPDEGFDEGLVDKQLLAFSFLEGQAPACPDSARGSLRSTDAQERVPPVMFHLTAKS